MWSISLTRPFGRLSARRSTLFASAILMALFAALALFAAPVGAQEADATDGEITMLAAEWNGDNIRYGIWDRTGSDPRWTLQKQTADSDMPNLSGSACENNPHTYLSSPGFTERFPSLPTILVICLNTSDTTPDKTEAIPANIIVFRATESDQKPIEFSRSAEPIAIKVLPEGVDPNLNSGDEPTTSEPLTTCDSTHTHGLGWIICPVTNWLADTMDLLYDAISDFLVVPMISTSRDNVMYYVWNMMRNIANILFILGFLIIIYSQITNVGLSNYGLKRLLPRLIIAAVLVNISYWITALAVDASNLLGTSLDDGIKIIRESIPSSVGQDYDYSKLNWKTLAATFLSGGSATFMAITGIAGIVASAGGSLWFLLVGLAGVIMAGLVAVLVLAARQAIITILVIISPLAFVAYLLPSTEKYFDKWKDLFMTLLLVFPIFSLIFGGAQLAGLAIMQNARPGDGNFYNIIVLGMIVQVAPLLITPLLLKVSGSLIGKIAGFANNPNRGLIDQTKKYAQSKSDMTKQSQLWQKDKDGKNYTHRNPLAVMGRWNALREADRSHKLKSYEGGLEAAYSQDSRSHDSHRQSELNTMSKNIGDHAAKRHFAQEVESQHAIKALDVLSRVTQEQAAYAESRNKSFYEEIQAKPGIVSAAIRNIGGDSEAISAMESMAKSAQDISYKQKIMADRQANIASTVSDAFHKEMVDNEAWQNEAGASEVNIHGALRSKASAQSRIMSASSERIDNFKKGFIYDKIDPDTVRAKASGHNIASQEEWEAAINYVAESRNADNIIKHHEEINLTTAPPDIQQAFELAYKSSPSRPVYATYGKLGMVGQGLGLRDDGNGKELLNEWQIDAAIHGKYGTSGLVRDSSKEEIIRLRRTLESIKRGDTLQGFTSDQYNAQKQALEQAFQNRNYRTEMGDKEEHLRELGKSVFGMTDFDFERWKKIP